MKHFVIFGHFLSNKNTRKHMQLKVQNKVKAKNTLFQTLYFPMDF